MQIINLPGVGHEKLCKLSAAEAEKIFDKNTKLKATQESENDRPAANDDSTGNGAWIMMKVRIRVASDSHPLSSSILKSNHRLVVSVCGGHERAVGYQV
jgi:hypothetical protein